jgi:hypothetical protein
MLVRVGLIIAALLVLVGLYLATFTGEQALGIIILCLVPALSGAKFISGKASKRDSGSPR